MSTIEVDSLFPVVSPYWSERGDSLPEVLERVIRFTKAIKLKIGFHLCSGGMQHKHFMEPPDTGLLVEVANSLVQQLKSFRFVSWIYMPCPEIGPTQLTMNR